MTPRQRELFLSWGYPYVLEDFRFHLTLGDPLVGLEERDGRPGELKRLLEGGPLESLTIDRLTLLRQEDLDQPFEPASVIPLSGRPAEIAPEGALLPAGARP
jgi:hypothetical protein